LTKASQDSKLSPTYHQGGRVKRIVGIILIVAMFPVILLGGLGCDEFDFDCEAGDYINVAVSASIHAQVTIIGRTEPWAGVHLEIQIIKDGGEREYFNLITNENGDTTEQCQATFKVYRHQMVDVIVKVISGVLPLSMGGEIFDPVKHYYILHFGKNRLNWGDLEDVGWGETYYWSPNVTIQLQLMQD
jgi:hypothetical protein